VGGSRLCVNCCRPCGEHATEGLGAPEDPRVGQAVAAAVADDGVIHEVPQCPTVSGSGVIHSSSWPGEGHDQAEEEVSASGGGPVRGGSGGRVRVRGRVKKNRIRGGSRTLDLHLALPMRDARRVMPYR
jgi:hypothetical protein